MYTSYIGKKFLKLYNQKNESNLAARQFFDEVLFPIFFDDEKHLMHVHGSTFFQKVDKKGIVNGKRESLIRVDRLHSDIANKKFSGSTFVGYAAEKIDRVTSGQVSSLNYKIDSEEVYSSWIGEGLSIGVTGGLNLISHEEILWKLFLGWTHYRNFLKQTPGLKSRQIETWNGHWLCHSLSDYFISDEPLEGFIFPTSQKDEEGDLAIPTIGWSKVIFTLAKKFSNQTLTTYVYSLSKTNTTIGFINFYLPEIHHLYELRDRLFLEKSQFILSDKQIQQLSTYYNFKEACKLGTIGLKALEPDKLREFMPPPIGTGKDYKFTDETSYLQFQIYKIWIIAMLNKTELLDLANKIANALWNYEQNNKEGGRGKSTHSQLADEVRNAPYLVKFLDRLDVFMNKHEEGNLPINREDILQIINVPPDRFPLFQTLIKLEYTFLSKQ